MSWWDQLLSKETRGGRHHDGDEEAPEIEARQPFSDGTEEFLEKFMPHDDHHWSPNKQVLIGLGITAGVVAGVGIAVWLKKGKRRKSWRDFLAKR
jgi:hypothetical protein